MSDSEILSLVLMILGIVTSLLIAFINQSNLILEENLL